MGGDVGEYLDLSRHRQERLLHVRRVLCRGLEEGDTEAVGEFLHASWSAGEVGGPGGSGLYLRDSVLDHLLVGHITLVTNKQLVHTLRRVTVDLLEPLLDVVEGICNHGQRCRKQADAGGW